MKVARLIIVIGTSMQHENRKIDRNRNMQKAFDVVIDWFY